MGALVFPKQTPNPSHLSDTVYEKLKFLQNAHGAVPSPFDCWLAMRGAKTLALRMKEHGSNAVKIARALSRNPHVKQVIYPGLKEHPGHATALQVLSPHARKFVDGWIKADDVEGREGDIPFGGMVSVRIAGDDHAAERFLGRTKLFTLAESLGGVESLAEVPEKMTHGVRYHNFFSMQHRVNCLNL